MRKALPKQKFQGRPFLASLLLPIGLLFPLLATIFVALQSGNPLPMGLWMAQRSTPWLWIVDVLPLLMGLLGRFLATPSTATNRYGALLLTVLVLICLFPSGMMLFAWQEARGSVQALRTTRLAGTLQTMALRSYVQLSQKPGSDLRKDLARMSQIRNEIKQSAPLAVQTMEPAWQAFYQETVKPGKLSLFTALRMRDAAEKLTHTLEEDARASGSGTADVLLVAVLGTLISLGLTLQFFNQLRQLEQQLQATHKQHTVTSKQLQAVNAQLEEANRQLESAHVQLAQTTTRDALTGLNNRRTLDERFNIEWSRALRYNEPFAVLLIDIDYFKSYNDSFGSPAGDAVLQTIGALLQHSVRISDFASRYGGEEFLVLLPHTGEEEATRLAERIRAAVQAAPWKHRGVTISIGVAERSNNMTKTSELTDAADVALYQAKKTRNRVCRSLIATSDNHKKAA
jgi:diguanylate cyclase (GGDEF)-like protein